MVILLTAVHSIGGGSTAIGASDMLPGSYFSPLYIPCEEVGLPLEHRTRCQGHTSLHCTFHG